MVFSSPDFGNGWTFTPRFSLFLRRKRLLPRRASYLGALPRGLPNRKAALYRWRPGLRAGGLLGVCAAHSPPSFPRTDDLPPPRADDQTQSHPQIPSEVQAGG